MPGMLADFCVLDRDIFGVRAAACHYIIVTATYVAGCTRLPAPPGVQVWRSSDLRIALAALRPLSRAPFTRAERLPPIASPAK